MWNFLANFGRAFWETYQSYQSYETIPSDILPEPPLPSISNPTKQIKGSTPYVPPPIIRSRRSKPMGSCTSSPSKSKSTRDSSKPELKRTVTPRPVSPKQTLQTTQSSQVKSSQISPAPIRIIPANPTSAQNSLEFPMDYTQPIIIPSPNYSPIRPIPTQPIPLQSTQSQPTQPKTNQSQSTQLGPNKPKRKAIPKKVRLQVWQTYIGSDTGQCYACGRIIDKDNWHCSHVISDKLGGLPTLENLRPCCMHCNLQCRDKNLYAFIRDTERTGPGAQYCHHYLRLHPEQA